MASSERPPFPREGWSDPQAEREQIRRTEERLAAVEAQHGVSGPSVTPVSPDPSMVEVYGGPPIVPEYGGPTHVMDQPSVLPDPSMVTMYGGPPIAPAYGGPMRRQEPSFGRLLLAGLAAALLVAALFAVLHLLKR